MELSKEVKTFFKEYGIDIEDFFSNKFEALIDKIDKGDLKKVLDVIYKVEIDNNSHKVLLFTLLLEMRQQIKKSQAMIADLQKKLDDKTT